MGTFRLIILFLFALPTLAPAAETCARPWIFFDLGNTLVDTETYDYERIFYEPGALVYLRKLRDQGYPMGLIMNVPESWGTDEARKIQSAKDFILAAWSDSDALEWGFFGIGVLVPASDQQRKPAPFLFEKAYRMAQDAGCPAVYEGEDPFEIVAAQLAGLYPYYVEKHSGKFLPVEKIQEYVKPRFWGR